MYSSSFSRGSSQTRRRPNAQMGKTPRTSTRFERTSDWAVRRRTTTATDEADRGADECSLPQRRGRFDRSEDYRLRHRHTKVLWAQRCAFDISPDAITQGGRSATGKEDTDFASFDDVTRGPFWFWELRSLSMLPDDLRGLASRTRQKHKQVSAYQRTECVN